MPRPRRRPATVQAPLTNRTFLTTSRSLGYHSKSIAREEGRGKGGKVRAKVSKQELEKGKTRDQTSQCSKVTRWKQRMKISVLRLHHQKVCSQKTSVKVSKSKRVSITSACTEMSEYLQRVKFNTCKSGDKKPPE